MMYMRFDSYHNKRLKLNSIQQINDGLIVMKHFFKLNQKLLPIYFDLHLRKDQNIQNQRDIAKINAVYDTYNFDVNSSKILLNSDILDYIQNAYFVIQNQGTSVQEKQDALNLFLNEYKCLKENWCKIAMN